MENFGNSTSLDEDLNVFKSVLRPGVNSKLHPWKGDRVWIKYTGYLEDGTPFMSR